MRSHLFRELLTPSSADDAVPSLECPPGVQAAEDALVSKIATLQEPDLSQYTNEYSRPTPEMYDEALEMMADNFQEQANGLSQMAPDGIPIPAGIPNLIQGLYTGNIMGCSPVDAEKDAYFVELLLSHAEVGADSAEQKMYGATEIESFLRFLFMKRTLLAASLINRNNPREWQSSLVEGNDDKY